jgi:hypothetical protein
LGKPVVEINVEDTQIDDRVNEALDYFTQFHTDGVEKLYHSFQITANIISQKYYTMPNNCIGVTRVFPLATQAIGSNQTGGFNMFDISYQVRLNEIYDMTSADYVYFELANQHLATLEMLFTGQVPIRYNRYTNKLYMDLNWNGDVIAGNWVIAECYTVLDESNELFWNDMMLKKLTTAMIKRQWGTNLSKFSGVKLPGGITLDGKTIYNEAVAEIEATKTTIRNTFETPAEWFTG